MIELIFQSNAWVALLTLTFLEIILGIDNIVFLSIVSVIRSERSAKSRRIGFVVSNGFRIVLLFGITWVLSLQNLH
jgi:predicted tellurium resistance membrane protein TerC